MKRSMGVRHHSARSTAGSAGERTGTNAQWARFAGSIPPGDGPAALAADSLLAASRGVVAAVPAARGSGAPPAIHAAKSATTCGDSGRSGGISSLGSTRRIARRRRLSSGRPGTMTGPRSPPRCHPSRLSSRKPPRSFSLRALWQRKQLVSSTGRIFDSKKSTDGESIWAGAVSRRASGMIKAKSSTVHSPPRGGSFPRGRRHGAVGCGTPLRLRPTVAARAARVPPRAAGSAPGRGSKDTASLESFCPVPPISLYSRAC
jgi:hypothetical protein